MTSADSLGKRKSDAKTFADDLLDNFKLPVANHSWSLTHEHLDPISDRLSNHECDPQALANPFEHYDVAVRHYYDIQCIDAICTSLAEWPPTAAGEENLIVSRFVEPVSLEARDIVNVCLPRERLPTSAHTGPEGLRHCRLGGGAVADASHQPSGAPRSYTAGARCRQPDQPSSSRLRFPPDPRFRGIATAHAHSTIRSSVSLPGDMTT
ncbi:hypothetical protein FPOAC2_10374 [Fusarium poae]